MNNPNKKTPIALLGTGKMGLPMARRLCEAGFEVHVWNRTRAKAAPLAAFGARVHERAQEGVAQAMQPGALFIDMASIQPRQAREHAQRLQALGLRQLDAPVSGGTVGAEQGTLAIMAGGEAADFEAALPVFKPLGRATHVGPHGAGQLTKLANQMIVGITIGAVADALLLAAKGGADIGNVL